MKSATVSTTTMTSSSPTAPDVIRPTMRVEATTSTAWMTHQDDRDHTRGGLVRLHAEQWHERLDASALLTVATPIAR